MSKQVIISLLFNTEMWRRVKREREKERDETIFKNLMGSKKKKKKSTSPQNGIHTNTMNQRKMLYTKEKETNLNGKMSDSRLWQMHTTCTAQTYNSFLVRMR